MARPGFWDDQDQARRVTSELSSLKGPLADYEAASGQVGDLKVLLELGGEEEDQTAYAQEIAADLDTLERQVEALRLKTLLNGKYDANNAIITLHPGAGGTESQDWAEMLLRMYTRWAESHGCRVQTLDLLEGDEAGIKSATLLVAGDFAYGFLRAEKGVHRLVRISPFDASGRRHTSFASLEVMPEVPEDADEITINPDELRVDTFRSSGAGGQHVNKTDSAVRITHLPTNIVVTCQNERSQHANRETAMRILRARLAERREEERAKELAELRGETRDIAWGSQIRSYVLQPYSLVKDHRTGVEVGNVQGVLDGDLDPLIYAFLQEQAKSGS